MMMKVVEALANNRKEHSTDLNNTHFMDDYIYHYCLVFETISLYMYLDCHYV